MHGPKYVTKSKILKRSYFEVSAVDTMYQDHDTTVLEDK